MIAVAEARRPETFPRWSSPIVRPEPVPDTNPAPDPRTQLAALRRQGWTLWFGQHTRQYWAAHTGRMRLLCADTPEELLRAVTAVTGAPGNTCLPGFRGNS